MNQNNSLTVNSSQDREIIEVPYSQINQVDHDYTGVLGFCGVILILGVLGYAIACFWLYRFFEHKKNIDQKKLENEVSHNLQICKKLDMLLNAQDNFMQEFKNKCQH